MDDRKRQNREQVRTYRVTMRCSDLSCWGQMEYTGEDELTAPSRHVHVCTNCGQREALEGKYPRVEYEPKKCDC